MTFLPIVERELRVAARRHRTYSMRLVVGLVAILLGVFLYAANQRASTQALGRTLFEGLSVVALLYCLAAGRSYTADCLSEEKREGTLGLLFLTDLKGHDVVLGKLAASSLTGFCCLLALLPVLATPLLMGGISHAEFWRMALVLVLTFLLSLAIGLLASVLTWDARRAMGINFLLLLALAAFLPACAGAIAYFTPVHRYVPQLLYSCPGYAFYLAFDTQYRWAKVHYWWSAGVLSLLTITLVAWACRLAPRSWQGAPSTDGEVRWGRGWQRHVYGQGARRKIFRTRLLGINAYYWLASRARFKAPGVWAALAAVAVWWVIVQTQLQFRWRDESLCLSTALLLNTLLKLWVGVEAGQRMAEDQKIGALELLLCTPLEGREMIRGQLLALRRLFLKPLCVVLAVVVFLTAVAPLGSYQPDSRIRTFGYAIVFMLICDLVALSWVAMEEALTARSPNYASVSTISRLLILPWLLFTPIAVLANLFVGTSRGLTWHFYLGLWVVLGLAADLWFGLTAWWRLRTQFRQLALRRFALKTLVQAPKLESVLGAKQIKSPTGGTYPAQI